MTVKQWIKKHNWHSECNHTTGAVMNVDISFINSDGHEDETEFSIRSFDVNELSELFRDFCKENNFKCNTVTNICIVETANSFETLL